MGRHYTQWIQSILNSASGLSVIELLMAATISLTVLGLALSVTLSSNKVYREDQARTALNQNLRVAMDILGANIREAGERLPPNFPAIEIINGDDGAPDELMIRRNVLDEVMPVCKKVQAGTSTNVVFVALAANPPQGCERNSQQANFDAWKAYRQAQGGEVRVYIYNPVSSAGEFFTYSEEKDDNSGLHIHRKEGKWLYDYDYGSAMYMLEERHYRLQGDLLQLVMNGDETNIQNLIFGVSDLQIQVLMQDGTTQESFTPDDPWTLMQSLEVTLSGESHLRGRVLQRTLAAQLFPRNILSN